MRKQPQLLWFIGKSNSAPGKWRLANADGDTDLSQVAFAHPRAAMVEAVKTAAREDVRITSMTPIGEELLIVLTPIERKPEPTVY